MSLNSYVVIWIFSIFIQLFLPLALVKLYNRNAHNYVLILTQYIFYYVLLVRYSLSDFAQISKYFLPDVCLFNFKEFYFGL